MRIREYTSGDLDALRQMHATQGFGYPLPDLESPLFVSKLVLEEDDDARQENVESRSRESAQGREAADGHSLVVQTGGPGTGRIAMAILLRLTAETYLLHDPTAGTPHLRWQRFLALHEAGRRSAAARGLDDVQAFLPPRVAHAFGRRLERLGWKRDPWPCFSMQVF